MSSNLDPDTERTLEVSNISCRDLPLIGHGLLKHTGSFYIQINVQGRTDRTSTSRKSRNPTWNNMLSFSIQDKGLMTIQVYAERTFQGDTLIGELESPLETLNIFDGNEIEEATIEQRLYKISKSGKRGALAIGGTIRLKLRCPKPNIDSFSKPNVIDTAESEDERNVKDAVGSANKALQTMSSPARAIKAADSIIDGIKKGAEMSTTVDDLCGPLLQNVSRIVEIVDELADIYPYAKLAWAVLSLPLKGVICQSERDQEVYKLLGIMNDIYELILSAKPLEKIKDHRKTIKIMCQQTTECAIFIREYATQKFTERMIASFLNGTNNKVAAFANMFTKLRAKLLGEIVIVTEIAVFQILAKSDELIFMMKEINTEQFIDRLLYALPSPSTRPERNGCDPGTRRSTIDEIMQWFFQPLDSDAKRLFWLNGVAGCGKTAVAQTVSDRLTAQRRCASFFFDASRQAEAGIDHLFGTISRDLAHLNEGWKACLANAVKNSAKSPEGLTIEMQFETLILQPASEVDGIGPILIVIDALDECGSQEQRKRLLRILSDLDNLPIQFRFLITSRSEKDITNVFSKLPWIYSSRLDRPNDLSTRDDIWRFTYDRLQEVPELEGEPIEDFARRIATLSGELFQWASTACKYISGDGKIGCDPVARLTEILALGGFYGLDGLYRSILDSLYGFRPGDKGERLYQIVMGRVLSLREPLSLTALSELWLDEDDKEQARNILSPLGSLLRGVSTPNEPIQPLHTSFPDFLRNKERSGKYWVNTEEQPAMLSLAALREMQTLLEFNICRLETSYVFNHDITNLNDRVKQAIPMHLSYACCFWVDHLCTITMTPNDGWYNRLCAFMQHYLLFWLEALSLLNRVERAHIQLSTLNDWAESMVDQDELKQLISDSLRFVEVVAPVLRQSTPHLYLSTPPFIPRDSPLSKCYLPAFPRSINTEDSNNIRWSQMLLNIDTSSQLWSIALSPDGKSIVSGLEDNTWSLWDVETGNRIIGPIKGHTDEINSVAFSQDGKYITSGADDMTVRIWEAITGDPIIDALVGHTNGIISVAFSPDGRHIASGSFDETIRVWDHKTGTCLHTLAGGHYDTIRSIMFSPDGKYLVSGSDDKTVIIWDWEAGLATKTLSSHSDVVRAVMFSPSGKYLVSSSWDKTVILWSAITGQRILDPLIGHTGEVFCVAFSPDGQYIASGSVDQTVRVWDACTGALVAGPFEGHGNTIYSVVFSRDGKRVISCSGDGTIKIWDIDAGKRLTHLSNYHAQPVSCIVYSPDGACFATASWDGTVRLWDSITGTPVGEPFQGHTDAINSIAFSPNEKRIVSGSDDFTLKIWNIDTGELLAETPTIHSERVFSVAFSPDGTHVASGSYDTSVRIWDAETGRPIGQPFLGHTDHVLSVAFSPDGKHIASGSRDKAVRIWDVQTGESIAGPLDGNGQSATRLAFSPDGTILISSLSNGAFKLWDTETWKEKPMAGRFQGHTDYISSVQFSLDGKRVISSSYDKTVRIWDTETGICIAGPFYGHNDWVFNAVLSPDGAQFVSGSQDQTVRIWETDIGVKSKSEITVNDTENLSTMAFYPYLDSFTDHSSFEDGWMRGPDNQLLFWIPPDYRASIWRPSNTGLIGRMSTRLDLSRFVHGPDWARCFDEEKLMLTSPGSE